MTIDCFIGGTGLNFSATLLPQLNKEDSSLKITEDQGTWIGKLSIL